MQKGGFEVPASILGRGADQSSLELISKTGFIAHREEKLTSSNHQNMDVVGMSHDGVELMSLGQVGLPSICRRGDSLRFV